MSKYRKGTLYVRRLKPTDTTGSLMLALKLAGKAILCKERGLRPPFVLVRHGMPHLDVLEAGDSRQELQASVWGSGSRNFKQVSKAWREVREA